MQDLYIENKKIIYVLVSQYYNAGYNVDYDEIPII